MTQSILAVIIARKGSKGLPSKCSLPLAGQPIVGHVMEFCDLLKADGLPIRTIFSTDMEGTESLCEQHHVTLHQRDPKLATDTARVEHVFAEAYERLNHKEEFILGLNGNCPIRYPHLVTGPHTYLQENPNIDAVLTFQNVEKYNPDWMTEASEELLPSTWKEAGYRRQDLRQLMIHDGHTLLFRASHFMDFMANEKKRRQGRMYEPFGRNIKPWIHDELIIDIDTEKDYLIAKGLMAVEQK